MEPIFIGCDHVLSYYGARSGLAFINDATCTYVLKDSSGEQLADGTLQYVDGTGGEYRTVIDGVDLAGLAEGAVYTVTITFATESGFDDSRKIDYRAARRGPV